MILAWGAGSDGKPTISPPETDRTLGEAGGANLLLMIIRLGQLSDSRQAVWQSRPKPQSHRQMASQNPILCDQVLVAEQQILIHKPRYERQDACPVESIAHGGTSIITTVGQRSSFARVFWLNGFSGHAEFIL
jgi:hypothetical protein